MFIRRFLGAAAIALSLAMPVAAAQITVTASLDAKPGKPFTGTIGGFAFALDTLVFHGAADTGAVTTAGSVHSVVLSGAALTATLPLLGAVTVPVLDVLTASFDDASDLFSLLKGGVAFVTATPDAGFAWDLVSNLGLTDVNYVVGETFTINTAVGALAFNLGPDGDGAGTGAISAAVAAVPLPAAAPLLLGAVGLLALGRRRGPLSRCAMLRYGR